MGNFDTVNAITENVEEVMRKQGIKFLVESVEDEDVKAATLPLGRILYIEETFVYEHGQKPEYGEIEFLLQVVIKEKNPKDLVREQQTWVHKIRDELTVNALNINDLASSKLVSRVTTDSIEVDNKQDGLSRTDYTVLIRYREV